MTAQVGVSHKFHCALAKFAPFILLAAFFVQPAQAQTSSASVDPVALLQKMQAAARDTDFSGVYTYQQGATMQSARIVHIVDGTGERERLEMLDGAPREFIRHNDAVQCLLPEKKQIIIEKQRADRFPGLLLGDDKNIAEFYTIQQGLPHNRVAGRECVQIDVIPKDHQRYGYQFCVDTETGLLIKAQTLYGQQVIDQIAFSSLQLGEAVRSDQLQSQWKTQGWKVVEMPTTEVDIAALGWRVAIPAGFGYVTQISRPMKSGKAVKQLVLSDGLAAISVFIEPYNRSRKAGSLLKGPARNGAINIFGTQIGDHWLTAIGEVPAETLRDLAQRTEYVPSRTTAN